MRFLIAFLFIVFASGLSAQQVQPTAPSHPAATQTKESTEKPKTDAENWSPRKAITPDSWPTWALVVVGICGTIYAARTLRAIRQESREIKEVADAASMNAQAVINAERPWLVVATFFDKDKPELCRFGCRNQGKTPAKIISISAQTRFVNNPSDLPIPPDYSSPVAMPDLTLIVHTDSFPIGHGVSARQFVESQGRWESVLHAQEFLAYFGNVIYRDAFHPESSEEGLHETRWCFVYQPGGDKMFIRSGPAEYNRYT